ncbi:hypothetical protein ACP70R_002676 [Stipagrostis hirtigluma subsp. patula]
MAAADGRNSAGKAGSSGRLATAIASSTCCCGSSVTKRRRDGDLKAAAIFSPASRPTWDISPTI